MPNDRHDSILDIVLARPWWVSLAIALAAYIVWRFLPPLIAGYPHVAHMTAGLVRVALPLSIMFAAVVPVALLSKLLRRRRITHDPIADTELMELPAPRR
jgi:hypothetical protein